MFPETKPMTVSPGVIKFLFSLLCFYLALPVYDVPFLGLSLSAVLVFFLFFETMRRMGGLLLRRGVWLLGLLAALWFGQLVSLAVNEIFGANQVNMQVGLLTLLRYAFWFVVLLLGLRLFTTEDLPSQAVRFFAIGIIILGIVLSFEFLFIGRMNLFGNSLLTGMTQNAIGWQFSAFAPYGLYLALTAPRRWKVLAGGGYILLLLAVVLNGSRSSWGTVSLGVFLMGFLWIITSARKAAAIKYLAGVLLLLLAAGALYVMAPSQAKERLLARIERSQNLDMDKSWQMRLLMIQKAETLFFANPIFGVGPGQFRHTEARLDIPKLLSYESEDYFNSKSSHNSYIQLLAEGGVAFMVPFGFFLLYLLVFGWRAAAILGRAGHRWVIPVYVSFICFSAHFWTLSGITSTAPWFLYGLLCAAIIKSRSIGTLQGA